MSQQSALAIATAVLVLLALLFGGGAAEGRGADALVQLASLPVLAMAVWRLAPNGEPLRQPLQWPLLIIAAILLLPLLQLVPLPPDLWRALPGRDLFARTFAELGITPGWQPISLDPAATWRAWLSLLPPVAVFAAVVCLNFRERRLLTLVLIGVSILALLLGLAQLAQGPGSALRFYPITNPDSSVGFFANRNHHAALLYCAAAFAAAWTIGLVQDRRIDWTFAVAVCGLIVAVLLLGIGMARSRAGIFLAIVVIALSMLLLRSGGEARFRQQRLFAMLAASVLGLLLILHYGAAGLIDRFAASPIDDYRFAILGVALDAARAFQPLGSGFGTFEAAYLLHDRPEALLANYVNHAHNDWIEIGIEGGFLAALFAAAFLAWFALATLRVWRNAAGDRPIDTALACAASISVAGLSLHSLVDYPLRTTALMTLFALCCGMLVAPRREAKARVRIASSE